MQVSWDSAYRSASEPSSKGESSGSASSGIAPAQASQGQQPQELKEEMAAAQAEGERELAHLDLQSGEALGTQASIPGRLCDRTAAFGLTRERILLCDRRVRLQHLSERVLSFLMQSREECRPLTSSGGKQVHMCSNPTMP